MSCYQRRWQKNVNVKNMKILKFRHATINAQEFLFSVKENNEEQYLVAYSLVRNLLIGMAKRARVFCSNKYDFADYPFTYCERQLDSILLPELTKLCNGYVFTEYPVIRNCRKKEFEADNSKGRIDYWCIYKGYSFAIELKHSYDNYNTDNTKEETRRRWKTMNAYQLHSIKKGLRSFDEKTKGIIPLALHIITSESSKGPSDEQLNEYKSKEREMLARLHDDLKTIAEPDFISLWELDRCMYINYQPEGYSYPGLILISKFYDLILHDGSKI
jgi:hypothetical protein